MRNCPICLERGFDVLWNQYVKCRVCGCVFVMNVSFTNYEEEYYFFDSERELADWKRAEKQLDCMLKKDKRVAKNSRLRVLDYGCGKGCFVHLVDRAGFEGYGADISNAAVSTAINTKKDGKYLLIENHDDLKKYFDRGFFDIITAWEVIEHLEKPIPLLLSLREHLKPGGLIVISTPNVESLWAKILKEKWHGFNIPEYHLVYYNRKLLENILQEAGFTNVTVLTVPPIGGEAFFLSKNLASGLTQKIFKGNSIFLKYLCFGLAVIPCKIFELIAPKLRIAETLLAFGQKLASEEL